MRMMQIAAAVRRAVRLRVAAPVAAQETTPAMVAAAAKEGKVVWYTSVDVKVAEAIAKAFRAEYPKIADRGRALRLRARVPAHQPGIPVGHQERRRRQLVRRVALPLLEAAEVARAAHAARRASASPRNTRIPTATTRRGARRCRVMGYNTNLVTPKDAPTGYVDLLDPKWKGKLVKSHPGYSGTSLTGTYAITKVLGWDYLEKLVEAGRAAAAVDDRDAEEHRQRRARGDGRRQRVQHVHRDRRQEPGEDHLPEGRHAVRDLADGDLRRRAASERRARAPELPLHREDPAAGWSTRAARVRCIPT